MKSILSGILFVAMNAFAFAQVVQPLKPDLKDVIKYYDLDDPISRITKFEVTLPRTQFARLRLVNADGRTSAWDSPKPAAGAAGEKFVVSVFCPPKQQGSVLTVMFTLTHVADGLSVTNRAVIPLGDSLEYTSEIGARVPVVAEYVTRAGRFQIVMELSDEAFSK